MPEQLPDGTYADWHGATYRAGFVPRPPGTARIKTPAQRPIPPGFTERRPGEISRLVPKSELIAMYHLQTFCRWRGEPCRVTEWLPDGRIQLTWLRGIRTLGQELGFETHERGIFIAVVSPAEVTDLHQEREDIPLS